MKLDFSYYMPTRIIFGCGKLSELETTRFLPGRKALVVIGASGANTEAGICESLSRCISHHSMEHAVSAYYPEVAHGAGLTMLSVSYFTYLAERNPARFGDLARAMGEDIDGLPEKESAVAFIAGLKKFITNVGLKGQKLADFGIQRDDLKTFAENSFYAMGSLFDITPVKLTLDDVLAIYENAYA